MPKKTDEGLVLNEPAKKALEDMLTDLMDLGNLLTMAAQSNATDQVKELKKKSITDIKSIENQIANLKKKSAEGIEITPQELNTLSNAINKIQDQIYTAKFESKGAARIKNLIKANPVLEKKMYGKKHTELTEQQQIDTMRNGIKSVVDNVQHNAIILRSNAAPKHRSLWERFTRACVKFANTCKDKILSLFGKKKQEAAPQKPLGFREAHEAEVKKDPLKMQFSRAVETAAEVARSKNRTQARAAAEQPEQSVGRVRPARPARPERPERLNQNNNQPEQAPPVPPRRGPRG